MHLIELIKAIIIAVIICSTEICVVCGFDAADSQAGCSLIGDLDCDGLVTMTEIKQLNIDLVQGKVSYDTVYKAIKNFEAKKKGSGIIFNLQPTNMENFMQKELGQGVIRCPSNIQRYSPLASQSDSSLIENNCGKFSEKFCIEIPWINIGFSKSVRAIISVGGRDFGKSNPLPLGSSKLGKSVINYNPIGRHVMLMPVYDEKKAFWRNDLGMPGRDGNAYFFGRDFSLGTIDNNYADAPFITQFLADP
jgi:hypothetical protein